MESPRPARGRQRRGGQEHRAKPWRASFSRATTTARKALAEQQWGAGLEVGNPLGLGDQLMLRRPRRHQRSKKLRENTMLYTTCPGAGGTSTTPTAATTAPTASPTVSNTSRTGDNQGHQLRRAGDPTVTTSARPRSTSAWRTCAPTTSSTCAPRQRATASANCNWASTTIGTSRQPGPGHAKRHRPARRPGPRQA